MVKKLLPPLVVMVIFLVLFILCGEIYLAWKQQKAVKLHLTTFNITQRRADIARLIGASISPNGRWFSTLHIQPPPDYPIGTFTNRLIVGYKELEGWPIHRTDQHGFINHPTNWISPEILLIGDSFVSCEHLTSSSLTKLLIDQGHPTLNLGLVGSGPFLQLTALKTYWPLVSNSVKLVVWCYYEGNDLQDTLEESHYHQSVLSQSFHHHPNPAHLSTLPTDDWRLFGLKYALQSVITLTRSRRNLDYMLGSPHLVRLYNQCLQQALSTTTPTQFILVRIPKPGMYPSLHRQWTALSAPTKIDMPPNPSIYSASIPTAHYTPQGYQLLASNILSHYH